MTDNERSSTDPSEAEKDRVDDLPSGATDGDDASEADTVSGGAPEEPAE